jgi:hypothetical protein
MAPPQRWRAAQVKSIKNLKNLGVGNEILGNRQAANAAAWERKGGVKTCKGGNVRTVHARTAGESIHQVGRGG